MPERVFLIKGCQLPGVLGYNGISFNLNRCQQMKEKANPLTEYLCKNFPKTFARSFDRGLTVEQAAIELIEYQKTSITQLLDAHLNDNVSPLVTELIQECSIRAGLDKTWDEISADGEIDV